MCRANSEGGRRCKSHSNDLRFKAAKSRAEYALENKPIEIMAPVTPSVLPVKPFSFSGKGKSETGKPADIVFRYVPGKYSLEEVRETGKNIDDLYEATGDEEKRLEQVLADSYGSALNAVQFVGVEISGRAEEYAGISAAELQQEVARLKEKLDLPLLQIVLDDKISSGYAQWLKQVENGDYEGLNLVEYEAKYHEFMNEYAAEERASYISASQKIEQTVMDGKTKLADGYRKALNDVRSCGGSINFGELSDREAEQITHEAAQIYPTSWLETSNKEGNVTVIEIPDRAHYSHEGFVVNNKALPPQVLKTREPQFVGSNPYVEYVETATPSGLLRMRKYEVQEYEFVNGEIANRPFGPDWEYYDVYPSQGWRRKKRTTVKGSGLIVNKEKANIAGVPDGYSVAAHELGHRMEKIIPGLSRMENHWLIQRTTLKNGKREPLLAFENSNEGEYVRKDSFINSYIGKEYETNGWHHEVFTVGVQSLFGGDYGGLIGVDSKHDYQADEDMRTFILGVMGSAGMSEEFNSKRL